MTIGHPAESNGFGYERSGEKKSRSTPLGTLRSRGRAKGATCANVSVSCGETSKVAPNLEAASRSSRKSVLISRRYIQLRKPEARPAYCRHLSESTSTISKI